MARKPIPKAYSGDGSELFWKRVNSLRDRNERDTLYACGVLLQETEARVLSWLHVAEKAQAQRRTRKPAP